MVSRIVYRTAVTNNKTDEHIYYYGISDTQFKDSYEIVMKLFSVANLAKVNTFINNCNLYLSEKDFIIRNLDDLNMLSKSSEFISKCRHINKLLLNRVKDDSNN